MMYLALDVGTRKSQLVVGDKEGNIFVNRRVEQTEEALREALTPYAHQGISCVFESCGQDRWLLELLDQLGIEGVLANPYRVKLIAESRIKTDRIDAEVLYHLLRTDFLPRVYRLSGAQQDVRERLRYRQRLVHTRTSLKNRIHGILFGFGKCSPVSDLFGKQGRYWLEKEVLPTLPAIYQRELKTYVELIDRLDQEVKELTLQLREEVAHNSVMRNLSTIPGVGVVLSALFYYEIGDISRFAHARKLVSYAGLCPSTYQSGQRCFGGHITKQGNKYLRWGALEAAQQAAPPHTPLRRWFDSKRERHGSKKARVALADRILKYVYWVWKKSCSYPDLLKKNSAKGNARVQRGELLPVEMNGLTPSSNIMVWL